MSELQLKKTFIGISLSFSGGSVGLLGLNGLFTLIKEHNL